MLFSLLVLFILFKHLSHATGEDFDLHFLESLTVPCFPQ